MTREEAIANLKMISVAFVEPVTKEQRKLIDDTFYMAIKALEQLTSYEKTINKLTEAISEQEPRKGHWEIIPCGNNHGEYRPPKYACSECGWEIDLCRGLQQDTGHRLFCEHCGADMRKETIAEEKQATPDLLVLRSPFFMKKEDADKVYEHFLKQKNKGMVILEAGWDCLLVPDDVKIRMEQNPWEIIINPMEELKNKIEAYYADCSLSIAEADEECKRCNDTVFGSILKMTEDAIEEQKERKAAWTNKTRL